MQHHARPIGFTRWLRARPSSRIACFTAAQDLAGVRALYTEQAETAFQDVYASCLQGSATYGRTPNHEQIADIAVTQALDTELIRAIDLVNVERKQEFHQVVLLGCGLDTRPQRLPWPEGTVIYEAASKEAHLFAHGKLKEAGARVPRGSLLRRVTYEIKETEGLLESLQAVGFRADRLSIWLLQGLRGCHLSPDQLRNLLTQISLAASFDSILLLELPGISKNHAADLLAEHKMQGTVMAVQETLTGTSLTEVNLEAGKLDERWIAVCHHKQHSITEMEIIAAHTKASEDTDEDFFDNFS